MIFNPLQIKNENNILRELRKETTYKLMTKNKKTLA